MNTTASKEKNADYETISEAMNALQKKGYTTDFSILKERDCLLCKSIDKQLSSDDFEIDEIFRFEGDTDPGDEMILYAISSAKYGVKGLVADAYGVYSGNTNSRLVAKLKKHVEADYLKGNPQKRSKALQPLSREHHYGLLLCWKIREGFKKDVDYMRIKNYADWFWLNYLSPHFEEEEKYIYPILETANPLLQKANAEHRKIRSLFHEEISIIASLKLIAAELDTHIRFEERILFNAIQQAASAEKLAGFGKHHKGVPEKETWSDSFWVN